MTLFSDTLGAGRDIVLLHGWGLHSGVWDATARALAQHFRVTRIDLPGHGRSPHMPQPASLNAWADRILQAAPAQAVWLGWSLGGMVAMQIAATHPERVAKLILIASTPKFARSADWPHAMTSELLTQFAEALELDYRKTIRRFLALQLRGSAHERETLASLNREVFLHGLPAAAALQGGLAILRDTDLRPLLPRITCPTLVMAGDRDLLIPLPACDYLAMNLPNGKLLTLAKSGHTPFLSHSCEFLPALNEFLYD